MADRDNSVTGIGRSRTRTQHPGSTTMWSRYRHSAHRRCGNSFPTTYDSTLYRDYFSCRPRLRLSSYEPTPSLHPIAEDSSLLRTGPPARSATVLNISRFLPGQCSPSRTKTPNHNATCSFRHTFPSSTQQPQTRLTLANPGLVGWPRGFASGLSIPTITPPLFYRIPSTPTCNLRTREGSCCLPWCRWDAGPPGSNLCRLQVCNLPTFGSVSVWLQGFLPTCSAGSARNADIREHPRPLALFVA